MRHSNTAFSAPVFCSGRLARPVLFLCAMILTFPAWAQADIRLQDDAPDRYTVQRGDTLWSISGKFLKEPYRWPEIWRLNKEQIKNPHRIYPGDVIVLDRSKKPPQLVLGAPVRLTPQVRSEPLAVEPIPAIPAKDIEPFLTQALVLDAGGLKNAPRIVGTQESRVHLGPGDVAYVSGIQKGLGSSWNIYRQGKALVDPDSKSILGYEGIFLGTGRVQAEGEPATVGIVSAKQEISAGDRLVAAPAMTLKQYIPRPPASLIRGRIIGMYDGLPTSEAGRNSIITINKGRRDGVEDGHVLALLRAGNRVPDPESSKSRDTAPSFKLPDERYGLLYVFRVFDAVSYGLVMESSRPVAPSDIVQTP